MLGGNLGSLLYGDVSVMIGFTSVRRCSRVNLNGSPFQSTSICIHMNDAVPVYVQITQVLRLGSEVIKKNYAQLR